jgi:acetoin utilization deacetylase AcuC-like enzyme
MSLPVYYSDAHRGHDPKTFILRGKLTASPEQPARAEALAAALAAAGYEAKAPGRFGTGPLAAVHSPDYLDFLANGHAAWRALPDAGDEIVANAHPGRHMTARPRGIVGLAGYHMADTACPIGAGTWSAVLASAELAMSAAEVVLEGAPAAYALCRPPGHHAFADMAGGFCFVNNVAVAAQHMRSRHARVAILDVDVHHGNGTQAIFYHRADVFFASLHGDPSAFYPFFAGYEHERGAGAGHGYTLNKPLAAESGDNVFLAALEAALAAIETYAPGALLVSLGLDTQEADPLGILNITTEGFAATGRAIAGLGLPTVLVQEGGYLCDDLGGNLVSFLKGFEGAHDLTA